MKRLCVLAIFLAALCASAQAETLVVGADAYVSLTEALAAARDGDEIVLAGGVYDDAREAFPILVDKAVTIRAREGETPVITPPIQVAAVEITAPGTRVEGIAVHFLYSGMRVLADDVCVTGCTFSLADEAWRTSSCGIWIGGAKRMTLTDNVFLGCGIAIAGPPVSETSAGKPVLTGMFEVGEDPDFFTTHTIAGNLVNGRPLQYLVGLRDVTFSQPVGQLIAVACENVSFEDMDVSRASMGVELAYCKDVRVTRVVADDCGVFGIYIAKTENSAVSDTRANGCAHGIDVRAVGNTVISGCTTNGCGQGVFLSWTQNCLVERCEIIGNGTGFFAASGDNNHMDACRVEDNQLGLYVQKEPLFLLTRSQLAKNTACGARVTHGSFVCMDNRFERNWVASMALDCEFATYCGNTFSGNENRALYIKGSPNVKLVGNQFVSGDALRNEIMGTENLVFVETVTPTTAIGSE